MGDWENRKKFLVPGFEQPSFSHCDHWGVMVKEIFLFQVKLNKCYQKNNVNQVSKNFSKDQGELTTQLPGRKVTQLNEMTRTFRQEAWPTEELPRGHCRWGEEKRRGDRSGREARSWRVTV